MERFERDGTRLASWRSGERGDPVVLIHGALDDHRLWDGIVGSLAPATQTLVYDRRGHGLSTGARRGRPVADDATDVAGLLEATGLYPAHAVASGYAAGVALRLAIDRPELVRSVVAHEPSFVGLLESPAVTSEVRGLAARAKGPPEETVRAFLAFFGGPAEQWADLRPGWREELCANVATLREELDDPEATGTGPGDLGDLSVPVLVTTGEASAPRARQISERLVGRLGNAHGVTLAGAGHLAPRAEPDQFAGVLGTFLLERNVPTT